MQINISVSIQNKKFRHGLLRVTFSSKYMMKGDAEPQYDDNQNSKIHLLRLNEPLT